MKVAILTLPLGHNYGGLLQAYALQTCLKQLGCDVEVLDRRKSVSRFDYVKASSIEVAKLLVGKTVLMKRRQNSVLSYLLDFRDQHIAVSRQIISERDLRRYCQKKKFDVFVVGSDQVWRPRYSPGLLNYYLDFLDDIQSPAKRISYAASFGVDDWEYDSEETLECKRLINKFDAISVRERSAVDLCRKYFNVNAEWMVDPTILIDASEYEELMAGADPVENRGKVLSYFLDLHVTKLNIARKVSSILGKEVISLKPENHLTQAAEGGKYPRVENWIKGFKEADFIVTDSFHGCVFSIIFNKPFIVVGNVKRGMSRFHSLLSLFSLDSRMIDGMEDLNKELVEAHIDWDGINQIKRERIEQARQFLVNSIFRET